MCTHKHLVYVGPQQVPNDKPLHLFNCTACYTTIGMKATDPRFKKIQGSKLTNIAQSAA
jgi:hypothetical protein